MNGIPIFIFALILSCTLGEQISNLRIYDNIAEVTAKISEPVFTVDRHDFAFIIPASISINDFTKNYSLHFPSSSNYNNVDAFVRRDDTLETVEIIDYATNLVRSRSTGKYFYAKDGDIEFDSPPTTRNVEIETDGDNKSEALTVSYLCTGISWRTYHDCVLMDDKVLFKTWAEIANSLKMDIIAERLELLKGSLKLNNFFPLKLKQYLTARDYLDLVDAPTVIDKPILIKGGETVKIPLYSQIFYAKPIYYVDFKLGIGETKGAAVKALKINNTERIGAGAVLVRDKEHFVSEYVLPSVEKYEGYLLSLGADENVTYRRTGRVARRLTPRSYELEISIEFSNNYNNPVVTQYAEVLDNGVISDVQTNSTEFSDHDFSGNEVSFTVSIEPQSETSINYAVVVE